MPLNYAQYDVFIYLQALTQVLYILDWLEILKLAKERCQVKYLRYQTFAISELCEIWCYKLA